MKRNWTISLSLLFFGFILLGTSLFSIKSASKQPKVNMTVLGEKYTNHFYDAKTKMNVYWKHDKDKIDFAIQSPGKGWVGIGFNPTGPVMKGADIFMGYVKNGKTYISEEYANTPVSHEPIANAGGKDCILSYKGESSSSGTTIAFSKSIKSCGKFDTTFTNKPVTVMLAYSNDAKNFTTYHGPNNHDIVQINFLGNNTEKTNLIGTNELDSYQIGLIVWGLLLLISGVIGVVSLLIEKDVSKLELIKKDSYDLLPLSLTLILVLIEIFFSAIFILELYSNAKGYVLGLIAGVIFLLMAFIVFVFRKYFIDDEIIIQDINDDVPW